MKKIILFLITSLMFFSSGCDDNFSVVKDYEEQIVAFLVLDNRNDKQFIRLQRLQNDVGSSNESKLFSNLTVKLVDTYGNARYFKDAVLQGVSNYNVLYLDSFDLKEGSYSLFANADDKIYAWSNAVVRAPQVMYVSSDKEYYKLLLSKSASSHGFLVKSFLTFYRNTGTSIVEERIEIPSAFYIDGTDTTEIYPALQKSDLSDNTSAVVYIRLDALLYTKNKLKNRYNLSNGDFSKIKIFAFSYDWNLYEYINSYSGYQDEFSIRLDKPNYTNITWGNGVFGAIRVDSLELDQ
jgi:hypothetical protein